MIIYTETIPSKISFKSTRSKSLTSLDSLLRPTVKGMLENDEEVASDMN